MPKRIKLNLFEGLNAVHEQIACTEQVPKKVYSTNANPTSIYNFIMMTHLSNTSMIRIMLVDDHPIVREALQRALSGEIDFDVVAEAEDGENAIALARLFQPDVIIMDVGIPKLTGIEATRAILKENPKIKIIALSLYDDVDTIKHIKNAGVIAYFVKGSAFEPIFEVIRNSIL